MNERELLNYRRLPGRLDVTQIATLLGLLPHEIPILVRLGLLKPLGNPAANAHKYFASVSVEQSARDPVWLDKATRAIAKHVRQKNQNATQVLSKMAA